MLGCGFEDLENRLIGRDTGYLPPDENFPHLLYVNRLKLTVCQSEAQNARA